MWPGTRKFRVNRITASWHLCLQAVPAGRSLNMLVLSRQRDETIVIGDDIEVTVVDIRGDKVRLGINAPRTISVHRKEVYELVKKGEGRVKPVVAPDVSAAPAHSGEGADPFLRAAIDEAKTGLSEGG